MVLSLQGILLYTLQAIQQNLSLEVSNPMELPMLCFHNLHKQPGNEYRSHCNLIKKYHFASKDDDVYHSEAFIINEQDSKNNTRKRRMERKMENEKRHKHGAGKFRIAFNLEDSS